MSVTEVLIFSFNPTMTLMIGAASRLILQLHNRVFTLERRVSFNGVCCLIWYMKTLKNCLISGVELAFSSCLTAAINMLRSSIPSPGASTNINVPLKNLEEYKKYLLVQSKSCEMKFPSQSDYPFFLFTSVPANAEISKQPKFVLSMPQLKAERSEFWSHFDY